MRFATQLLDSEIVPLLNRLIQITGYPPWHKKFSVLQQQLNENHFLKDWQEARHGIELKFRDLLAEHA